MKKKRKASDEDGELMDENDEVLVKAYHKQFEDYFAFAEQNNVRLKDAVEMHLADLPFKQILSGEKTVEVRLYDEKRREIREGDVIVFYRENGSEWLCKCVKALYRAPTFAELFEMPDMLAKAGFSDMPPSDAADCMHRYYTTEQERQYGVLGIELSDL